MEALKKSIHIFWNAIGKKTSVAFIVLHSIMLTIYYGFGLKGYVLGFDIQCIEIALWCGYNAYVINKWIADNRDNEEYHDPILNIAKWISALIAVGICVTVIPLMIIRARTGLFLMPWP